MRAGDLHGDTHSLVVLFESDEGWNATGGPELLPQNSRHAPYGDLVLSADGNFVPGVREIDPSSGWPLRKYHSLQW